MPVASGIVDLLQAAAAQFERIVASLPAETWDNATPSNITVREIVDHVVAGNIFAIRLLAGASAASLCRTGSVRHCRVSSRRGSQPV
jgi:hypothetical protein